MIWTDEAVSEMRALAQSGLSSSAIGNRMGCSRSTIIGKCSRMGIALSGSKRVRPVCRTPDRPQPTRWSPDDTETLVSMYKQGVAAEIISRVLGRTASSVRHKATALGIAVYHSRNYGGLAHAVIARFGDVAAKQGDGITDIPATDYDVGRVHLFELKRDDCRFVIGEPANMVFCGLPRAHEKTSWCPHHHAVVISSRRMNLIEAQ